MKKEKNSIYEKINNDTNELIDNIERIEDLLVIWNEETIAKKLSEI